MPRSATAVATATILAATPWSGYTAPERRVIVAPADWAAAWSQIHARRTPVPALPDVDFSRDVVILAAMGARRSTGFSIVIDEVRVLAGTFSSASGKPHPAGTARSPPPSPLRSTRSARRARRSPYASLSPVSKRAADRRACPGTGRRHAFDGRGACFLETGDAQPARNLSAVRRLAAADPQRDW
jgi:hypothetical protein